MRFSIKKILLNFRLSLSIVVIFFVLSPITFAAGNEELYDPEPPLNSSFLRLIQVGSNDTYEVLIDGIKKSQVLKAGSVSDYFVVSSGSHRIELKNQSNPKKDIKASLTVLPGYFFTYAFINYTKNSKEILFKDLPNLNQLKSQLTSYNLTKSIDKFDLETTEGKISIFKGISQGSSKSITVNPIDIFVSLIDSNAMNRLRLSLHLEAGKSFSLFLFDDSENLLTSNFQIGSIEKLKRLTP
jgi:hypothetical protein